jgi:hypothetical protein
MGVEIMIYRRGKRKKDGGPVGRQVDDGTAIIP